MHVPDDLLYTDEHEWLKRISDTRVRVGITDYAQDQLGDVVFVELPEVGKQVSKDDILVARIRRDLSDSTGRSISIFSAGDQFLKGAALNAVQIAEKLLA